ncbi:rpfC [Symbiodinium sp. CCMP2592]|nr:rpfC [Symbiodinium sp. CCMP2592]
MTAALEPIRLTSFGEAKLAVAEQLCATELEAQSWRLRCFQAEAQLRLQRLQRRGEQHPRWPQDVAAQQQLQNSYAALKALDFTSIVQETLRDVVLTRTSVGHLQDLLEQTSREVAELEEDAATKRARAISLSEGAASEDATFETRERELEEHKEKAREMAEKLRQRFVLENDLAEQIGKAFHVPLVAALASHGDGGEMAVLRCDNLIRTYLIKVALGRWCQHIVHHALLLLCLPGDRISYFIMHAFGDMMVHTDELCIGGPRPVYTIRYLQWCFNVPILMMVSGNPRGSVSASDAAFETWLQSSQHRKLGTVARQEMSWCRLRDGLRDTALVTIEALRQMPLAASARLTSMYIVASWLALVVQSHFARWVLIAVAFSAYFVASTEQIMLFCQHRQLNVPSWTDLLLAGQVLIFGFYGFIYLFAVFGLISSASEQAAYTYSDILAKMTHSVIILAYRRTDEVLQAASLRDFAVSAAADLKRMIREASVPIFSVTTSLKIDEWNGCISELTGVTPELARGKTLTELFAEGKESQWQHFAVELLTGAIADDPTGIAQFHFSKMEDEAQDFVIIAASARPLRDRHGEICGAVCIGQDVTELMLQRQEAQALAAGLTQLVDTAPVPIFEVNQDMRVTEWNSWLVQNIGLTKAYVLDAHLFDLLSPSSRRVTELIQTGKPDTFELTLEGSNSKQITLRMNAMPRINSRQETVGFVLVGQDITELKDIGEWKSAMMAIISHELKSPLHGIMGLSQGFIVDDDVDMVQKRAMAMVSNCAKRLIDIVSNIMDAAEMINQRNRPMVRDPVMIESIIREMVLLCQQAVDKRGLPELKPSVKIINAITEPLPMIEGDAHRCAQLMHNLISNAIKFTHKGSVTISASPDDVEKMVTVDVKDTGIGISPNNLERIFEPFDQEDRSEQRRYEGMGMGLALCREIALKHGGSLSVKSKKGKGSTFSVKLPYWTGASIAKDLSIAELQGREKTSRSSVPEFGGDMVRALGPEQSFKTFSDGLAAAGRRAIPGQALMNSGTSGTSQPRFPPSKAAASNVILTVDDNMVNQQVVHSLLRSSEYTMQVAVHGGEALSYLSDNPLPALVLLEVMMPGLSGPDVLRTLRQKYPVEILPVIVMSASSDKDMITKCLKLGANDFVKKPFHPSELLARMQLQCNLARAQRRLSNDGPAVPDTTSDVDDYNLKAAGCVDARLLEGMIPAALLETLTSASGRNPQVSPEAARQQVEEFLSNSEKIQQMTSTIEELQSNLAEERAKHGVLSESQLLLTKSHALRLQRLQEEVKKREQRLLSFGRWRDAQKAVPASHHVSTSVAKNINRLDESLMIKESGASGIIASLPEAEASALRELLTGLREEALRLQQESSCKDQLLMDASFKMQLLGMSLVQKVIPTPAQILLNEGSHIPEHFAVLVGSMAAPISLQAYTSSIADIRAMMKSWRDLMSNRSRVGVQVEKMRWTVHTSGTDAQVAVGQDQVERLQREIQAFLPSQQQMQQEARQAQHESDKARSLAQRRREAVSKLEEEAQQVERSAEEEQATMSARLEQMRTDLNETVASTTELGAGLASAPFSCQSSFNMT